MSAQKNIDVRRVKTSLVATFAKANPPLIWRFDLDRNHSFTLALQGDDNEWELGVTSPKGEFNPVARFPMREDAEEALARVGDVLTEGTFSWVTGFLKSLGILSLFLLLLMMGWSVFIKLSSQRMIPHQTVGSMAPPPSAPAQAEVSGVVNPPPPLPVGPPTSLNGVPLPADEVLKPPPQ